MRAQARLNTVEVTCPACDMPDGFYEDQRRVTWQSVEWRYVVRGYRERHTYGGIDYGESIHEPGDVHEEWGSFDYGDDADPIGYRCRACDAEFDTREEIVRLSPSIRRAHAEAAGFPEDIADAYAYASATNAGHVAREFRARRAEGERARQAERELSTTGPRWAS